MTPAASALLHSSPLPAAMTAADLEKQNAIAEEVSYVVSVVVYEDSSLIFRSGEEPSSSGSSLKAESVDEKVLLLCLLAVEVLCSHCHRGRSTSRRRPLPSSSRTRYRRRMGLGSLGTCSVCASPDLNVVNTHGLLRQLLLDVPQDLHRRLLRKPRRLDRPYR